MGMRTMRIMLTIVVILLASSLGQAAEKLLVATGGFSPSVPPFVSFAKPFLLKQDIEIEDVLMSSGSLSAQALASGQVKIILTTSAVVPQFNLSGGDMVIVAGTINKLPYQIIGRGEIKTPALLKGKRIAISRFGSSSEWLVRLALAKMGLDPDKDVTIIQIGGPSERLAALLNNAVQATLLGPPTSTNAVRTLGMVQLAGFDGIRNHLSLAVGDHHARVRERKSAAGETFSARPRFGVQAISRTAARRHRVPNETVQTAQRPRRGRLSLVSQSHGAGVEAAG